MHGFLLFAAASASSSHNSDSVVTADVDPAIGVALHFPVASRSISTQNATWEKFLLESSVANGAVCLDGSPGGGYIRRGDPNKWIIFHQGGGWCSSDENCAERMDTPLGSSKNWGPTYTDTYEGSQLFAMPPFSTYTIVYAMYCDGGSWSANADSPVIVPMPGGNRTVYYRGRRLLDALIDHLLDLGLKDATNLLYSGCSAGGLTTYLHTDYVAGRMPSTVKTLALADAMFSVDHNSFDGQPLYPERMQWGYSAWNSSASVNQECLAAVAGTNRSDGWKCMFGSTAAQYVKTPLFVLNSKYDTWQEKAIIGVNCSIQSCPRDVQSFWAAYSDIMVSKAQALPAQHGVFLGNCPAHCQTGISSWEATTIDGIAMGNAFSEWYAARVAGDNKPYRYIATCDIKPCGTDTC